MNINILDLNGKKKKIPKGLFGKWADEDLRKSLTESRSCFFQKRFAYSHHFIMIQVLGAPFEHIGFGKLDLLCKMVPINGNDSVSSNETKRTVRSVPASQKCELWKSISKATFGSTDRLILQSAHAQNYTCSAG